MNRKRNRDVKILKDSEGNIPCSNFRIDRTKFHGGYLRGIFKSWTNQKKYENWWTREKVRRTGSIRDAKSLASLFILLLVSAAVNNNANRLNLAPRVGHKSDHCSSERQDPQIPVVNRLFVTEPRSIREIQRGACVKEVVGSEGRGQKNKGSTVREPENIRLLGSGTKKRVHGEDDKKSDESTFHPWTMPALFASILARSKKNESSRGPSVTGWF